MGLRRKAYSSVGTFKEPLDIVFALVQNENEDVEILLHFSFEIALFF